MLLMAADAYCDHVRSHQNANSSLTFARPYRGKRSNRMTECNFHHSMWVYANCYEENTHTPEAGSLLVGPHRSAMSECAHTALHE